MRFREPDICFRIISSCKHRTAVCLVSHSKTGRGGPWRTMGESRMHDATARVCNSRGAGYIPFS
jgi:hypothetical protein